MRSKCERQSASASVCILLNTVQPTGRAYRLQRSLIAIQCGTCVLCINVFGTRQYQFVKSTVNGFTFLRIFRVLSFRVRMNHTHAHNHNVKVGKNKFPWNRKYIRTADARYGNSFAKRSTDARCLSRKTKEANK